MFVLAILIGPVIFFNNQNAVFVGENIWKAIENFCNDEGDAEDDAL